MWFVFPKYQCHVQCKQKDVISLQQNIKGRRHVSVFLMYKRRHRTDFYLWQQRDVAHKVLSSITSCLQKCVTAFHFQGTIVFVI